jgi:hypothetical protein
MQVSKRLVVKKEIPIDTSKEFDLIKSMDVAMADYYCKSGNLEVGLKKYREALPKIIDDNERSIVVNKFLNYSMNCAQKLMKDK